MGAVKIIGNTDLFQLAIMGGAHPPALAVATGREMWVGFEDPARALGCVWKWDTKTREDCVLSGVDA